MRGMARSPECWGWQGVGPAQHSAASAWPLIETGTLFLNVMVENNVVSTVQYDTASNLGRRPGVSLLLGESTLTALFHCKRVDSCLGRLEEA